jgi:hypothetical protein
MDILAKVMLFLALVIPSNTIKSPIEETLTKVHTQIAADSFHLELHKLVHPLLIFTKESDLEPCDKYMDIQAEFNNSLDCANKEVFSQEPYNTKLEATPPTCFVVTKRSADVQTDSSGVFNYISSVFLMGEGDEIVGFFDGNIVYLVENTDIKAVYRHEVSHYFLQKVTGDGDAPHANKVWQTCQSHYYSPSDEAKKVASHK